MLYFDPEGIAEQARKNMKKIEKLMVADFEAGNYVSAVQRFGELYITETSAYFEINSGLQKKYGAGPEDPRVEEETEEFMRPLGDISTRAETSVASFIELLKDSNDQLRVQISILQGRGGNGSTWNR